MTRGASYEGSRCRPGSGHESTPRFLQHPLNVILHRAKMQTSKDLFAGEDQHPTMQGVLAFGLARCRLAAKGLASLHINPRIRMLWA